MFDTLFFHFPKAVHSLYSFSSLIFLKRCRQNCKNAKFVMRKCFDVLFYHARKRFRKSTLAKYFLR